MWTTSNNGIYNVKDGYRVILNSQDLERVDIPLKLCWDISCLPKVGFFLWLAIQNRILTTNRLYILSIQGPSRCVLCKQNFEDVDHILYNCPYSQTCWEWLRYMLGWSTPLPKSLSDLLRSWPTTMVKGVYNKLWNISPSIVMWEIWKERNRRIFCNLEFKSKVLITKIEASIVETSNSYLRNI